MSVKKVHQFRCIQFRFTYILLFVRFLFRGNTWRTKATFCSGIARGSLYPGYQRYFSSEAGIFGVGRSPKPQKKKNFSLFAFFWLHGNRKPRHEVLALAPLLMALVFRPRPPSFIQYGGFVEFQTGRQARGALFLKLASFRRTKVHQEILLENLT